LPDENLTRSSDFQHFRLSACNMGGLICTPLLVASGQQLFKIVGEHE